jgi:competence ComEA-like helix-hairpin-helix protein
MLKSWDQTIGDMRVDVNSASKEILKKIKGIGPKLAKVILDYKEKVTSIKDIEELKEIDGIGKNKFNQLKSRLKIGE